MKKTLVAAVIAALVLIVLASMAFAARPAAPQAKPFTGILQGPETATFSASRDTFEVSGDVAGTATQLGTYTLHYQIHVVTATGVGTNGVATFTLENGDKIYATGTGQGGQSGTPGIVNPVEHYTITGGTGRFSGASGSYVTHRLVQQQAGMTWGSFDGTITIAKER